MTMHDQHVFNALMRNDLLSFTARCFNHLSPAQILATGWHLEALAWHLEQVFDGKIRRLIITLPPRHLKSIMTSVAFPAWILGRNPSARAVCASYSSELADKHALDCRRIITAPWYQQAFPRTRLSPEKNAVADFNTTALGGRLSTSVGGTLTGRGGQILIFDDPMKPDDALSDARRRTACEWFDNTAYTRLDDKRTGAIIIVMQRLHMEDLVGHVLAKDEEWVQLNLPATAPIEQRIPIGLNRFYTRKAGELLQPDREPQHVLDVLRQTLGDYNYSAQYQQEPIPVDGEVFKWGWFQTYDDAPARVPGDRVIQSWDTASKDKELNDYSVCTTWLVKGTAYYLLDVFRKRMNFPDLRKAVISQCERWRPTSILIEDKASGTALVQDFKPGELAGIYRPIPVEPEGDKITRAFAQSNCVEAGQVYIPKTAPWLADLRSELVQFPSGRYDDQVDSISQFLSWIRRPYMGGYKARIVGI
jgi:predicted phage terminase large subunit-like protein